MKEILSVFQSDWATTPSMNELKPNCLKGKSVLVSGHAAARAFAYTLLSLNDRLKLGIKVILSSDEEIPSGVMERDDFNLCEYGRASAIKQKVDLIIHTGICGGRNSVCHADDRQCCRRSGNDGSGFQAVKL